jgi:acetyl esterase/lipase
MRRILPLAFLLALAAPVRAAAPPAGVPALRETLDVRYHPGKARQTLDVFAPPAAGKGRLLPVVVFAHGGTWMAGDKNFYGMYRGVGRYLARHGVVAVMINYRLSPLVRHPEHARDVARAFAWTRRHIAAYGGDPDRIVLAGHSAGAHLASLVVTDASYLKDPALKLTDRDRASLRGAALVSGVYRIPGAAEFRAMVEGIVQGLLQRAGAQGSARQMSPLLQAVGARLNPFPWVFGTDPDVRRQASPLSHVRKGLPPFLLLNAEVEIPGLKGMAQDFAAALRKAGNRVETREVAGCTHHTIASDLPAGRIGSGPLLLDFVRRCTDRAKR